MVSELSRVALFAHQGGWDEFLFAAGPILLIASLLRLANSRAKKLSKATPDSTLASSESASPETINPGVDD